MKTKITKRAVPEQKTVTAIPTQQPQTLSEKKKDALAKLKTIYKIDLLNHKFALFMSPTSKKIQPIPGVLFIKGKGYLIGTYPDRGSAMKVQALKNKATTVVERNARLHSYKIYLIADNIKTAAIKAGLQK